MTLAGEDTNLILTDYANMAIQGNVAMHVTLPGGQLCNQCKWRHLVAKFGANVRDAFLQPNLHVCKWRQLVEDFATNASGKWHSF